MKPSELKTMIKDAVKEAIHEEFKEIILEAIKTKPNLTENNSLGYNGDNTIKNPASNNISTPKKTLSPSERRAMFGGLLEDMQNGNTATTNNIPFIPTGPIDPVNGALPAGEVGLDMIMGLMNK